MTTKDRRYIYFRKDANNNSTGTICVGYAVDFDKKTVKLATTFCMPRADRFSKKEAHRKLEDRLKQDDVYTIDYEGKEPAYRDMVAVVKELLTLIAKNELTVSSITLPSWAKSHAKKGFPVKVEVK